jgi:hypothetical protein
MPRARKIGTSTKAAPTPAMLATVVSRKVRAAASRSATTIGLP